MTEENNPTDFSIEIAAQNIELEHNKWYLGPKVKKYIRIALEYSKSEHQKALAIKDKRIEQLLAQIGNTAEYYSEVELENKSLRETLELCLDAWGDYSPAPGNSKAYKALMRAKQILKKFEPSSEGE